MEQPEGGPYLQAAFFCERLLKESDGVLSAIRIVDTVTIAGEGEGPQPVPPLINLTLFIAFKAGQARGSYDLTVAMEEPSEDDVKRPPQSYTQPVVFDSRWDQGVTVVMPVAMTTVEAGVYWFGIYLDERPITRVLLRVDDLRQTPLTDPQ